MEIDIGSQVNFFSSKCILEHLKTILYYVCVEKQWDRVVLRC